MLTAYKAVRGDNHTSWYDNKTTWISGETIEVESVDRSTAPCGIGLHSSLSLLDAVTYQQGPSEYLRVKYNSDWVLGEDETKTRTSKLLCGDFLTKEETDSIAGFSLWEANHTITPLLIPRKDLSDEELKELTRKWASVRDSVCASVWASVRASVRDSLGPFVWASVWNSVGAFGGASAGPPVWDSARDSARDSVSASVWAYIGGLFPGITTWKYVDGPDPWRPLLTLWYSGYVPSFDGQTWRLHVGEKAEIYKSWPKEEI